MKYLRFAVVGGINTLVDLGVFSFLAWMIYTGPPNNNTYIVMKSISFFAAVVVSYVLNARFVFKSTGPMRRLLPFLLVSIVGLIINAILGLVSLRSLIWLFGSYWFLPHVSVLCGALGSAIMNFIGYDRLVFQKNKKKSNLVS